MLLFFVFFWKGEKVRRERQKSIRNVGEKNKWVSFCRDESFLQDER